MTRDGGDSGWLGGTDDASVPGFSLLLLCRTEIATSLSLLAMTQGIEDGEDCGIPAVPRPRRGSDPVFRKAPPRSRRGNQDSSIRLSYSAIRSRHTRSTILSNSCSRRRYSSTSLNPASKTGRSDPVFRKAPPRSRQEIRILRSGSRTASSVPGTPVRRSFPTPAAVAGTRPPL